MTTLFDHTSAMRPGEELDIDRVRAYVREHLQAGEAPIEITQFPGGHSNLTYLVRVGGRELILRRPPHGSAVKGAHDMSREYQVLSRLAPVYAKAPKPVLFCQESAVLGAEFYLMEPIRGVILRRDPPSGLPWDAGVAERLCDAFIRTLAELHAIDYQAIGLGDFGKPEGYVERQVQGWKKRYEAAQTEEISEIDELAAWLIANMPSDSAPALIHNDFKFDNLVLDPADPTRVIGVLDWEMATIGDPLMDLGTTLCYWVQDDDHQVLREVRFGPTDQPGMLRRTELVERYRALSGREVKDADSVYYYCFGLFKTAVVVQQIYYRYRRGLTTDKRFATMNFMVRAMGQQALQILQQGHI